MDADDRTEAALTLSEFTDELARDLGEDPDELRSRAADFDIEPPWEADVEPKHED